MILSIIAHKVTNISIEHPLVDQPMWQLSPTW